MAYRDALMGGETGAPTDTDGEEPEAERPAAEDDLPDPLQADAEAGEPSAEAPAAEPLPELPELSDAELRSALAALLFASPEPLSVGRLVDLVQGPGSARVKRALAALADGLADGPLPVRLADFAGGYRLVTDPSAAEVVGRLQRAPKPERISGAALETLAIVAYRQPVTAAEIEAIRGVQSGSLLRGLVDRRLVKVTGRADQPGSPLQYGTTREFLERFGLARLEDLPRDGELAGE
jgi:segregation and condensation protein B